jgi:hypothetical protein
MISVQIVKTADDILKCRGAVQALRPSLTDDIYEEAVEKTLADNRQIIFIH